MVEPASGGAVETKMTSMGQPAIEETGWERSLAAAIRDPDELIDRLRLEDALRPPARRAAELFPLVVPHSFLNRMRPGDAADPLLRQVLPLGVELHATPAFTTDTLSEDAARRAPGLLQKYQGRALLIAAGACAVHCRYCFRRHYPYAAEPRRSDDWEPALKLLAEDRSLSEVILSGGDPLVLSDRRLGRLFERLEAVPHLRRLRIHTRLPVVLPERVTEALVELLVGGRLQKVVVLHANHANELVADAAVAATRLKDAGVMLLNQSVLLAGVNDCADALADLSERLIVLGVWPYYLHQLDRVAGAAHFEVPIERGRELMHELRRRLPGYAVPNYVQEVPGRPYKLPLV
ncbi:MAG: EF-P beta-lysylation protein EpmB [Planctomycetes bacterium]|nr:EF-P beta-lysylation protein EpmB [Planctomycetota bacterium]